MVVSRSEILVHLFKELKAVCLRRLGFEGMSENHFLNLNLFPTALYNRCDFEGKFLKIDTHAAAHL